jgi:hypothetical protein
LWKILIFTRYLGLLDVDQMPCSISREPDSSTRAEYVTRRHQDQVLAGPLLLTYIHRVTALRPRDRILLVSSKAAHQQRLSSGPSDSERRGYEVTDGMTQKASQGECPAGGITAIIIKAQKHFPVIAPHCTCSLLQQPCRQAPRASCYTRLCPARRVS